MSDLDKTMTSGTSRRTVVRTAAHAAWAVPAIQIVAMAPAFADSAVGDIQNPTFTVITNNSTTLSVGNLSVGNDGPADLAANSVRLTMTITGGQADRVFNTYTISGGSQWVYLSGQGSKTLVFAFSGTVPVGTVIPLPGTLTGTQTIGGGTKTAALSYVP